MEGTNLLENAQPISVLKFVGITHPFFDLSVSTVVSTWIVMILMSLLVLFFRQFLFKKESYVRFCVIESITMIIDMVIQNLEKFYYNHFSFIAALFFFITACNLVGVFHYIKEPTIDVNTTFALAIIGLLYRDFFAIRKHGIIGYIKEYFQPLFFMFPLHIMGKISSLISLSFRLFGNIYGGAIISGIWFDAAKSNVFCGIANFLGVGFVVNIFFGIFEGLIQSFVFAMLSLTYLSLALAHEETHDEELEKVIE